MRILAIETSCDETAAAVLEDKKVLANIVASQIEIHKKTGGVVPEVASRAHVEKILPVITEALRKGLPSTDYRLRRKAVDRRLKAIDLIAVTTGPGLIGSLLVGVETAKALAYAYKKPILGINHLEGHIYSNFIGECQNSKFKCQSKIKFPAICLTVSGGHTSLVLMKDLYHFKIIGETRDDAAGEAFDKVAKILSLGYPGGPAIEACARCHSRESGNLLIDPSIKSKDDIIKFPRPMLDQDDFSFSGLKTAVLYEVMKHNPSAPPLGKGEVGRGLPSNNRSTTESLPNNYRVTIAYEFQKAVVETLVEKTIKAAKKHEAKSILLSGGVAANKLLRTELEKRARGEGFRFHVPSFEYCTDNAAMIGVAAYIKSKKSKIKSWKNIQANANLSLN